MSDKGKPAVGIGSTVWWFDQNCRVYAKSASGGSTGSPIYREHWRETTITGETLRSWVTLYGKFSKADGTRRDAYGVKRCVFSLADVKADCWIHEHRYAIRTMVGDCDDVDVLKRIAEIVGYKAGGGP